MRLTVIIIIASMLQVSASTYAQKLSYVKKDITLAQLFKEIKKQTSYNVVWVEKKLDVDATINANFRNVLLADVFDQILDGLPLSYTISDKTITIKEKALSLTDKIRSLFASIDIRGRVLDENNEPLVGAVVKVKGGKQATSTNSKGEFLLKNVDEKAILEISFLGYVHQEIKATEKMGDIKLVMSEDNLQEVQINAGYYTVTERERTGSISRITSKEIEKQPVNNVLMALQGRVPGLQIVQQTGIPGGGFSVQVRGRNSISSGNDPLYIIDGIIYPSTRMSGSTTSAIFGGSGLTGYGANPLANIDPNDISTIEILKDADATAIYGSRGANGVILITTKGGVIGKTKVETNITRSYSQVGHRLNLFRTEEYLAMRREAFKNDGTQPGPTDFDINGTWDPQKYTDWQEVFIGGTAKATNASLNVTGGIEKNNYLIGGNYYKDNTVFPGDFGLERVGIRSNINIGSKADRFNATLTANFSHLKQDLLITDLTNYIFLAPNTPDLFDNNGKLNYSNNTLAVNPFSFLFQPNDASVNNLIGNVNLSYRLLKNLTLKSALGYSYITRNEFLKIPLYSYNPSYNFTSADRNSRFSDNYNNSLIFEPQLDYNSKIGLGNLNALIGMSLQNNSSQFRTIQGSDYTSDELMDNIGAAANITNRQMDFSEYKYIAAFARLNYSLSQKYFINLTARRDGSSRFGSDKQFANFGAFGAAWLFSREEYIKEKLPFLSFGKLRASYGVTGNDQIGNYGYLQLWSSTSTYQGKSTITPGGRAPNPDFSWEKNRKAEASLQLGFLKDRVNLEVSFYKNKSSNQLIDNALPLSTGLTSVYSNSPAEVQNSGWEFDGNIKILDNKSWQWSSSFNLSIPKNKLIAYPGLTTSPKAIDYEIGQPLSIIKTYNVTVNDQTGLYVIEDYNNNGVTQDDKGDRYIIKYLGQYFYGGLQNSIKYKQFSIDFHVFFAKQNGRGYKSYVPNTAGIYGYGNEFSNQTTEILNRWQSVGDKTYTQRFGTTSAVNSANNSIRTFGNQSIVDASFIRLRNVALSYSLPRKWLSSVKISNVVLNIQGQNIFTITKYVGLDPETQAFNTLPPLRTLMIGLNVTL